MFRRTWQMVDYLRLGLGIALLGNACLLYMFYTQSWGNAPNPFNSAVEQDIEPITAPRREDSEDEYPLEEEQPAYCWNEVDEGVVEKVESSREIFCSNTSNQINLYSYFHPEYLRDRPGRKGGKPSRFISTMWRNMTLDLTHVKVTSPVESVRYDGFRHDPRLLIQPNMLHCQCSAFHRNGEQVLNMLHYSLYDSLYSCAANAKFLPAQHHFKHKIIAFSRKDDHNPFFQISAALNAWIMQKIAKWDPAETQVLLLDDGFPTPTEILQQKVLSPHPLLYGHDLIGKVVSFDNILFAPIETTGPLMARLNSNVQPCHRSSLITSFKHHVLKQFSLTQDLRDPTIPTITIISRRNYKNRTLGRKWINEEEVVDYMSALHPEARIQSLDFVNLTMSQQIHVMRQTDLVIGMHGAGLVNVLWLPKGARMIEIFPEKKRRWGFRNICQYTGIHYVDFRGGRDHGKNKHNQHKTIPKGEWVSFFEDQYSSLLEGIAQRQSKQVE